MFPWRAVNSATSLLSCSLIIVISCFIGRLVGLLQDNWAGQGRALWSWSRNWWIFLAPGDKLLPPAVSWGYCLSSRNVHPPLLETRAQKYKEKLSCNSYLILHHRAKECFGLEGTFKSPLDNLPVINRDTLHQTMFLRALPNLNICQRLQKCWDDILHIFTPFYWMPSAHFQWSDRSSAVWKSQSWPQQLHKHNSVGISCTKIAFRFRNCGIDEE